MNGLWTILYWELTMWSKALYHVLLNCGNVLPGHEPCVTRPWTIMCQAIEYVVHISTMCYWAVDIFYQSVDHKVAVSGPHCTEPLTM